MSLETPRSSAGLATPRTFDEVFADVCGKELESCWLDSRCCTSDEDESAESRCESRTVYEDDADVNENFSSEQLITKLMDVCSDCDRCERQTMCKLADLETKLTEESLTRDRQLKLLVEFEKKTRNWLAEQNATIEKLKLERSSAVDEQNELREQLEIVLKHLDSLENSFNDVHEKYERAKNTIEILNNNVETLKNSLREHEECMKQKQVQFDQLKEHAIDRLNQANAQLDLAEKSFSTERMQLYADSEARIKELGEQLELKDRENAELMSICEFLLQSFEETKSQSIDELIHASVSMWLNDIQSDVKEY